MNLLPWREQRTRQQNWLWCSLLLSGVIITCILLLMIHKHLQTQLQHLATFNQHLRSQLINIKTNATSIAENQLKQINTATQMTQLHHQAQKQWQKQWCLLSLLLNLGNILPATFHLTDVDYEEDSLQLQVSAQQSFSYQRLLMALQQIRCLQNIQINNIKEQNDGFNYTIQANI